MRRRTGGTVLIVIATLACAGAVAWGSITDDSGRDHDPANRPGYSAPADGTTKDDVQAEGNNDPNAQASPGAETAPDSTGPDSTGPDGASGPSAENSPGGENGPDAGTDPGAESSPDGANGSGTGSNPGAANGPETKNGIADGNKAKSGRDADHVVIGATGGRREAVFAMIKGTDVIRVRSADLGGDLYRISTPNDSKVAPSVHVDDDTVFTSTVDTGGSGPAIVIAELSSAVRWHVRLGGGANEQSIDLTGGKVSGVELNGGTSRAEVTLPEANGTTRLTMSGGAAQLLIHLGGNAPVQVRAGGGAGTVTVDRSIHSGVAGGSTFTPVGWSSADDRYYIDASAGVGALTVDRRRR